MFATLLGGLPKPDGATGLEAAVDAVVRAQEDAGLEPITDGRLGDPVLAPVDRWRMAAGLTDRAVKQVLPGPYSLGWAAEATRRSRREHAMLAAADAVRDQLLALAAAGCPLVEVEETEAHRIGEDEGERRLFRELHRRLADGVTGTHLSLSIVGGAADKAGIETILSAPYASLAIDLIAGPDNWNLVTRTPGDRGIVVGALGSREANDEQKEILLWAAHYAASTGGRGIARVGMGSAGSYANLTWAAALRKLRALGTAARLAALPPGDQLANAVDPRSISARRAALGGMVRRAAPKRTER